MKISPINRRCTERWKADIQESVLFYNDWFLNFAPKTYVAARKSATGKVEAAFAKTEYFRNINAGLLAESPETVAILRMATTPPLARDRLAGLANLPKQLLKAMEEGRNPRDSAAAARIV